MGKYRRVTLVERCQINAYLQAGISKTEIANLLGFHKSTIYRELRRNFHFGSYTPFKANEMAMERYRACRRPYKLQGELLEYVVDALKYNWSPEQIAGRLKREKATTVSHTCIYQFIERYPELSTLLRRQRKRGAGRLLQKRRISSYGTSIRKRPAVINDRRRIGDWERDSLYGAQQKQLLICTERKTRYTLIVKPETRSSSAFAKATTDALESTGKKIYSITNDNGPEFRGSPLPYKTYHCDPMKPQQRGTVENMVGLIRQWIKRKTDLDKLSKDDLRDLQDRLNFRPRKCLNYKTPFEAFYNLEVALAP